MGANKSSNYKMDLKSFYFPFSPPTTFKLYPLIPLMHNRQPTYSTKFGGECAGGI